MCCPSLLYYSSGRRCPPFARSKSSLGQADQFIADARIKNPITTTNTSRLYNTDRLDLHDCQAMKARQILSIESEALTILLAQE